jgi:hypothetical protein
MFSLFLNILIDCPVCQGWHRLCWPHYSSKISRMLAKSVIETGQVTANEVSWQLKTYVGWVITEGFMDVQFSKLWVGPAGQQMEWELLTSTEGVTDHVVTLGVLEPPSTLTVTLETASLKHYQLHSAIKELFWLRCSISLYIHFEHRTNITAEGVSCTVWWIWC